MHRINTTWVPTTRMTTTLLGVMALAAPALAQESYRVGLTVFGDKFETLDALQATVVQGGTNVTHFVGNASGITSSQELDGYDFMELSLHESLCTAGRTVPQYYLVNPMTQLTGAVNTERLYLTQPVGKSKGLVSGVQPGEKDFDEGWGVIPGPASRYRISVYGAHLPTGREVDGLFDYYGGGGPSRAYCGLTLQMDSSSSSRMDGAAIGIDVSDFRGTAMEPSLSFIDTEGNGFQSDVAITGSYLDPSGWFWVMVDGEWKDDRLVISLHAPGDGGGGVRLFHAAPVAPLPPHVNMPMPVAASTEPPPSCSDCEPVDCSSPPNVSFPDDPPNLSSEGCNATVWWGPGTISKWATIIDHGCVSGEGQTEINSGRKYEFSVSETQVYEVSAEGNLYVVPVGVSASVGTTQTRSWTYETSKSHTVTTTANPPLQDDPNTPQDESEVELTGNCGQCWALLYWSYEGRRPMRKEYAVGWLEWLIPCRGKVLDAVIRGDRVGGEKVHYCSRETGGCSAN